MYVHVRMCVCVYTCICTHTCIYTPGILQVPEEKGAGELVCHLQTQARPWWWWWCTVAVLGSIRSLLPSLCSRSIQCWCNFGNVWKAMDKVKWKISYSALLQKAGNDCSISPPVFGHQALTLCLSFAVRMKRLDDEPSVTEFTTVSVSILGKNEAEYLHR